MGYDRALADRVRELLAAEPDLAEQPMFGGLAFLAGGRLVVTASRDGGLLVPVDAAARDHLLATTVAEEAQMGARTMRGWVRVAAEHVRDSSDLASWVTPALAHARRRPAPTTRGRARRAPRA